MFYKFFKIKYLFLFFLLFPFSVFANEIDQEQLLNEDVEYGTHIIQSFTPTGNIARVDIFGRDTGTAFNYVELSIYLSNLSDEIVGFPLASKLFYDFPDDYGWVYWELDNEVEISLGQKYIISYYRSGPSNRPQWSRSLSDVYSGGQGCADSSFTNMACNGWDLTFRTYKSIAKVCGDGIVNQDFEICDDGEDNGTVYFCSTDCRSYVQPEWLVTSNALNIAFLKLSFYVIVLISIISITIKIINKI